MNQQPIIAYKGFNADLTCRDFQFRIGETYTHEGKVEACASGFHACENPLDVFNYYGPTSRFAIVECSGEINKESNGDSKIACGSIHIKAEIGLPTLISKAVDLILSKIKLEAAKESNTGDYSAATNTGDYSAATNTGYYSAATNTGDYSAATNTGNRSAATNTGYRSAATNTGDYSAATNTGDYSAATNTGYRSAAEVTGAHSVAAALGYESKAKAGESGAIVCVYRNDDYELIHIRASKVGVNGIEAGKWYTLDENGEFIEAK